MRLCSFNHIFGLYKDKWLFSRTRLAIIAVLFVVFTALTCHVTYGWMGKKQKSENYASPAPKPDVLPLDIPSLFEKRLFYQSGVPPVFTKATPHGELTVHTTIQPRIQEHMLQLFQRYAPLIAAGVVLDATSGAVLAMANYTKGTAGRELLPDGEDNYCLFAGFPAASLIKIVTAAAALEHKGFSPDTTLPVVGHYYSLCRSQLGLDGLKHRGEQVPLDKAFALSINPFFGLLCISYLSDAEFTSTARGFLFNTRIPFDLPLQPSMLMEPHDDFERAQMASGYNTHTLISPLHAALIASLPANDGVMMRPYLVDRIVDATGKERYTKTVTALGKPLHAATVQHLRSLMQGTVQIGTARHAFAYLRSHAETKDWITGGKTGSINLPDQRGRCDWFAGFGQDGDKRVAVACILIHGQNRTVRSAYVASQAVVAGLADTPSLLAGRVMSARSMQQVALQKKRTTSTASVRAPHHQTKVKRITTRKRTPKKTGPVTGG
ncbi:MAG: penicillin-binding transpeptidase domain-containing protein [Desulfobacterota bacterium]|nr:penicillin-binding transpeptidase domain-containing protein [Thermodesulfobacteriota bacterium]